MTSDQISARLPDTSRPKDHPRMILSSNIFKTVSENVYRFEPEEGTELQLHDSKAGIVDRTEHQES